MAVIGARPARPWFLGWRSARRSGSRSRPHRESTAHRVRAQRRVQRRDVRPLLLCIAVAAGLALFYLSQSTRVAATGYEIDALQASLAEQNAMHQQLVSAIGHARSPAEITERARRELGLIPLDPGAVQFVRGPTTIPPHWSTIDH